MLLKILLHRVETGAILQIMVLSLCKIQQGQLDQAGHKAGLAGYELVKQLVLVACLSCFKTSNHVKLGAGLNW